MIRPNRYIAASSLALFLSLPLSVAAAETTTASLLANGLSPASSLLSVDQHRETIVDRVVRAWGDQLIAENAGLTPEQLREALFAMRADKLLAASLAGSLNGLLDIVAQGLSTPGASKDGGQTKALGDPGTDLVYVPVVPCRLLDTRAPFPAVYQNQGPFAPGQIRTYTVEAGNGVCVSQLPPGTNPAAVQLQVFGIPANGVSGDIEVLPQGSSFGSTATLVFLGNNAFTSSGTTARVSATNQISVQVRSGLADVAMDVVGYFRSPPRAPQQQTFTYNLPPGATSAPIAIPVTDTPVLVQGVNLTLGYRGVSQITLFSCCGTTAAFLEWVGLSSTSGAAIVQGFASASPTLITQIDFSHFVLIEVHDAMSIQVHNTNTSTQSGMVTLTW